MQCNVGGVDRLLRMVVGVALIVLAIFGLVGSWGYAGIVTGKQIGRAHV